MATPRSLSVLVVDDSAVVRQAMVAILSQAPDLLVSVAADPYFAMEKMGKARPDVILLDLEMPRMDGLTFLRRIMAEDPIPVVVCSGSAARGTDVAIRALEQGAVEVLGKPALGVKDFLHDQGDELIAIIRSAAEAKVTRRGIRLPPAITPPRSSGAVVRAPAVRGSDILIGLGASTGGPETLRTILEAFPEDAPGTIVVQHMPAGFTAAMARRLDGLCRVRVKEVTGGEAIVPGTVLIAPGDRHVVVRATARGYVADLTNGPRVSGHRPSVDVLFRSMAQATNGRAVAALLTGMGADGAAGLLELRQKGAATIAQDEASSVVWGMPKEAVALGAAETVLSLEHIAPAILTRVRRLEHLNATSKVAVTH
jgi:two-component system chemotaxis response regulator CheB